MRDVCLQAVLIPPQEERLRARLGLGEVPLRADVTGWHKYAIVAEDRVFLLPRHAEWVPGLERELAAYAVLGEVADVPAPRLLGRYADPAIWPYPFGCVTRLPGIPFGAVERQTPIERYGRLLEELAALIATWHSAPVGALPAHLASASPSGPAGLDRGWGRAALRPGELAPTVQALHAQLASLGFSLPPIDRWIAPLEPFAALPSVLIHGDLHEDQILVADDASLRIVGILDWETARVDHPAWDFNFGEWGHGIWEHRQHFSAFRRRMWATYCRRRGLPCGDASALHIFFSLVEMAWCLGEHDAGRMDAARLRGECAWRLASLGEGE
jgi:aminoglycoside phosphotransferase (APT) family kinase protein